MLNKPVNIMSAYILIVIFTFTIGQSQGGIATSTIQVEHKTHEACEAMLKAVSTSVTGSGSQIRLAGCYKR